MLEYSYATALKTEKYFERIRLTYDIACQYYVNMLERFGEEMPEFLDCIGLIRDNMLIGKLHLDGHQDDCKFRFSLNYAHGCGRTDGEEIERLWALVKPFGKSTCEMNSGHRHDTLNDVMNHHNFRRLQSLGLVFVLVDD